MMPRSLLFLLFLFINVVVLGQGQTVKITPGDSAICKGQSIRYNAYLYKGSFQFIGSFDGKDYFMDTISRSWTDARLAAQGNGMDLWVIDSIQENDAVYNMIPLRGQTNTFFWFGLFQDPVLEAAGTSASGWKWLDGRALDTTFKYWYYSPPFVEPDDVFQSSIGANHAALGLNNSGARWSDMTNIFSSIFKGHAIAEVNKSTLILEWSTGETNTGSINVTPLSTQSYFLDITYGGNKTRSNTSLVTVNQAMATASFDVPASSDTCLISNNVVLTNTSVSTDPSNTTYEWNFGDGSKSTQFSTTYQFRAAQIFTVILTAKDINGCETFASRPVTIKSSPLIPVITYPTGSNIFCTGDSAFLNTVVVQPDPAAGFVWYRNAVLAGNGRSLVAKISGTYLLECTNLNGCTNRTSVNVTVNSLPSKPALTIVNGFSNVVCQLDSSYLQSSTAINITKFNWYTGGAQSPSLISNASLRNHYVKAPVSMGNSLVLISFFVRSVDDNGCISPLSDSVVITFKPSPVVALSVLSGKTIFCEGDSTRLIASSKSSGNTYQWRCDLTNLVSPDSFFVAKITGSYGLSLTNSFGCSASSNLITILANKYPIVPVIIPDANAAEVLTDGTVNICTGSNLNLRTANLVGGIYQWFRNGVAMFPPGINSSIIVNAAAKYQVLVSANGCTSTSAETLVELLPLPTGSLIAPLTNSICEGYTVKLDATGAFGYQWYFNNSKLAGAVQSSYIANGPGLYKVEFSTNKGCKKMSTNFVNLVTIKKPTVLFTNDLYCINVASSFTNKSETSNSGSVGYSWRFQNGKVDTNFNVVHVFTGSGNYRVSLTVKPKDCPQLSDSSVVLVKVDAPPKGISYFPINAMAGKPISLVARAIGDVYQWRPSTGLNSAFIRLPILNPTTEQLYTVNITNRSGCNVIDSQLVRVFDESDIYVAGGFTPNRDGKNDRVYPIAVGVSVFYSIKIFNRWGNLVFESNSLDPDLGWDGSFKGKDQPADTYTWVVYGIGQTGKPISKSGSVVLIR
jgi:gliding motility-associated-like protein